MDLTIEIDTVNSGWSLVFIEETKVVLKMRQNAFCGISSGSSLFAKVPFGAPSLKMVNYLTD